MSKTKRAPLTFTGSSLTAPVQPLTGRIPQKQTAKEVTTKTRKHVDDQPAQHPDEIERQAQRSSKKGRAGRQFIAAHVVPEAAKQLKLLAVQAERTTQDLLIEAINDLFAKHGLSRIAD